MIRTAAVAALFSLLGLGAVSTPARADAAKDRANAVSAAVLEQVKDGLWQTADHYWHDGDYNRIVALGRLIVEIDPSFEEAFDSCAWLLWSLGDTKGADDFLAYGVTVSPRKGIFYSNLGQHLNRTKRYQEALEYLKKAVELGGVPASAYSTLGHLYTQFGKLQEAVDTWKACVAKYPKFPAGPKNLKAAEQRLAASKSGG
ncbi:MAG: tetratricopeptide repeat protein [Armatimonadota bacterium]